MAADGNELLENLGLSQRQPLRLNLGAGRTRRPLSVALVRELTLEDIVTLGTTQGDIKPQPVKELRQQHHAIAKLLAEGKRSGEAAAILGIGAGRISILQSDPAFQDLLAYYQDMGKEEFERHQVEMGTMLHSLGVDSIGVLHEKLLENPEAFTPKDLLAIATMTADRSGHGPSSTVNQNVTHALDDVTLAKIRASTSPATVSVISADDRQRLLGNALRATEVYPEAQEAEWEPSQGSGVREASGEDAGGEVAGTASLPPVDKLPRELPG